MLADFRLCRNNVPYFAKLQIMFHCAAKQPDKNTDMKKYVACMPNTNVKSMG